MCDDFICHIFYSFAFAHHNLFVRAGKLDMTSPANLSEAVLYAVTHSLGLKDCRGTSSNQQHLAKNGCFNSNERRSMSVCVCLCLWVLRFGYSQTPQGAKKIEEVRMALPER